MQFLCKHIKIRTREPSKVVVKIDNSSALQQNATRIHQPLQNPHNSSDTQPVELVIGALQVDSLRLRLLWRKLRKIATTSILIPFAKFAFMYGGENLRIPASRSLLCSHFFPKKRLRRRLCKSLFGLAAIMNTITIVSCMCHEVYQ